MSKKDIIEDLETTIKRGGNEKVIQALKRRLSAVKSGKPIQKMK